MKAVSRFRRGTLWSIAACGGVMAGAPAADADPLRILPLGDSITWGWGSESTSGYRELLGDLLTDNGISHEFVGSMADELTYTPSRFIDPPLRQLPSDTPLHYGIPGAEADRLDGGGQSEQSRDSLLWSIRNDQDGDGNADAGFASAGGLIPTLVNQSQAPDAILLHLGTNTLSSNDLAVTPNPGLYNDNAGDSQLYRFLLGLEQDLSASGLLSGGTSDTRILLARVVPRAVDSRQKDRLDGIDADVLLNSINYNASLDAVVASLSPVMQEAITFVDMWDVDLTDSALGLEQFRDDGIYDQAFDTFTGGNAKFNEDGSTVGGQLVDEAFAAGPDYADWILRYAEEEQAFYDAAVTDNELRWNQGLFGLEFNGAHYDAIHPNVNGYNLMAHLWYEGLFRSGAVSVIPEPAAAAVLVVSAGLRGRRRLP